MHSLFRGTLLVLAAFCMANRGFAATAIGSITITGTEQSSGSTWDTGTVTATINGVSVQFNYGRFSSPAAIASALGALISQNCNIPVYAKANGAILTLYRKGTNVVNSASITSASSNPSLFPTNSFLVAGGGSWSPPLIDHLSLTEGPVGMGFIIYGTNLGSVPGTVYMGNVTANIVSWDPGGASIVVEVPSGLTTGSYTVAVTNVTWWDSTTATAGFQVDNPFGCN